MSVINNGILLASEAAAAGGYQISRSLRFNGSVDSAYLSRTPASAGNRRTFTFAFWYKRSNVSTSVEQAVFTTNTTYDGIRFENNSDKLRFFLNGAGSADITTTQAFRDPSAWYHFVIAVDTTQATASNRVKLYVNGSQITTFDTSAYPSQNYDCSFNSTNQHVIGYSPSASTHYLNGYLADIHFIDGQALDPTSFGETDATTGVWNPKAYTGSYGTNGFRLPLSDNSGTTSTTLGKDSAGSNNWTPNNFSVSSGAGNDSLVDVPTNGAQTDTGVGGEVRGNYCTFNPIARSGMSNATLANGNLDISGTGANYTGNVGTIALATGKYYWEYTVTATGDASGVGIIATGSLSGAVGPGYGFAQVSDAWIRMGTVVNSNSTNAVTGLSSIGANDVVNVAVDIDAGKLWFGRNGTWESSGAPASGTNATVTFTPGGKSFYPCAQGVGTWSGVFNAGARSFAYTAPSGFKALCTANLPAPSVTKPSTVMDVLLYTGNGATPRSITGLNFSPDLVWTKKRSASGGHGIFDVIRGSNPLASNNTADETTNAQYGRMSSFDSAGFTVMDGTAGSAQNDIVNANGATYVAWTWDAGSSTVTNTAGSITSSVRANATAGFSVVTYTVGNNTSQTIGHGLGVAPQLIIVKERNQANNWFVYHASLGNTAYLSLNATNASSTSGNLWNSTSPTSTLFTIRSGGSAPTYDGRDCVAYCFAPVVGYSSFGSYTGNGSSQFVYLGFRPKFWMHKRTDSTGSWMMVDAVRSSYNVAQDQLYANLSNADSQYGGSGILDFVSNGVVLRSIGGDVNGSSIPYIYIAFAESPFNYARAR